MKSPKMWALLLLFLGVASFGGCRPAESPKPEANESAENSAESSAEVKPKSDAGRGLKVRPNVKTFPGRWGLVMTQALPDQTGNASYRDVCLSLIELTGGDGQPVTGKVVASLPGVPETEISDVSTNGNKIRFQFQWGDQAGEYAGTLTDGVVRGALNLTQAGVVPVMLRPTEETTYEGWDPAPLAAGREILSAAASEKDQPASLLAAAKEMRGSALALQAFDGVMSQLRIFPDLDEKTMRQIYEDSIDSSSLWGERVVARSKYKAAIGATMTHRVPDLAQEWITAAEQLEASLLTAEQRASLKFAREQSQVDRALIDIKSKDAAVQKASFEKLQEFLPRQRYNPIVLNALGNYAVKTDQNDLALNYFADIIALPLLESTLLQSLAGQPPGDPTPRDQLASLWEKSRGSKAGLDEFLAATYKRRLQELSALVRKEAPPVVASGERHRVVLLELMTGGTCEYCVAADLAVELVQEDYPNDVAAVVYHQHNPGPDAMTNPDSEERFVYYQARGTPMIWVDGMFPPPEAQIGGLLEEVETSYLSIRGMIDYQVKTTMTGQLTLAAEVQGGILKVSANASELPKEGLDHLRMRLALVEENIELKTENGIRDQRYVVREMPGGAKGVSAKDGTFAYELQMPLEEIEEHLSEYLRQFEVGRDITFVSKPVKPGALWLVGWVQNDSNHLVLVTGKVPVLGTGAVPHDTEGARESPAEHPASALDPVNVAPMNLDSANPAPKSADEQTDSEPAADATGVQNGN